MKSEKIESIENQPELQDKRAMSIDNASRGQRTPWRGCSMVVGDMQLVASRNVHDMTHYAFLFRTSKCAAVPPTSLSPRYQNAHKSAGPDAREVESELQDTP